MRHELEGQVAGVYVTPLGESLVSVKQPLAAVTMEGFPGDKHSGLTRLAGPRERHIPRGTEIRNDRQVSLIGEDELVEIARILGLQVVLAEHLGANLLIRDILELTKHVPAESRLIFSRGPELIVSGENLPCMRAGREIERRNPEQMRAAEFVSAAMDRRGLVAYVDKPGKIHESDQVRVVLPPQRTYSL